MELHLPQKKIRTAGWIIVCLFAIPAAMVPAGVLTTGGELWAIIPGMLVFLFGAVMFGGPMLYTSPNLCLSRDGVQVKVFLRTRSFLWHAFQQAGVLYISHRGIYANYIVLLTPGGTKRKYRDDGFQLRNLGKLVYLPCTEEVRQFVTACYGPLDFDLSAGRPEQSTMVD